MKSVKIFLATLLLASAASALDLRETLKDLHKQHVETLLELHEHHLDAMTKAQRLMLYQELKTRENVMDREQRRRYYAKPGTYVHSEDYLRHEKKRYEHRGDDRHERRRDRIRYEHEYHMKLEDAERKYQRKIAKAKRVYQKEVEEAEREYRRKTRYYR